MSKATGGRRGPTVPQVVCCDDLRPFFCDMEDSYFGGYPLAECKAS